MDKVSAAEYEAPCLEDLGTVEALTHDDPDKSRGKPETQDAITIIWSDDPPGGF